MPRSKNHKNHPVAGIMTRILLLLPLKTNGHPHRHNESVLLVP